MGRVWVIYSTCELGISSILVIWPRRVYSHNLRRCLGLSGGIRIADMKLTRFEMRQAISSERYWKMALPYPFSMASHSVVFISNYSRSQGSAIVHHRLPVSCQRQQAKESVYDLVTTSSITFSPLGSWIFCFRPLYVHINSPVPTGRYRARPNPYFSLCI